MLFLVSCTKEVAPKPEAIGAEPVSTLVTPEMARANLESFLGEFEPATRGGVRRTIADMHVLGGFGATRADGAEDEPLVYLFNFADNQGFSLVSGDTRVEDILAFVPEGNLDPDEPVDNPGLAIFLENGDTYYRAMTGLPIEDANGNSVIYNGIEDTIYDGNGDPIDTRPITSSVTEPWETTSTVGSVIPCEWGQGSPNLGPNYNIFNKYCFTTTGEQAYAGCIAIAVAQIMYYHGLNTTYNGEYFDWNVMRTVKDMYTGTVAAKDKVARLIFQLGRSQNLDMDYGGPGEGSSAYFNKVPRTFANFDYSRKGTYTDYDISGYKFDIPLFACGQAKRKNIKHKFLGITIWTEPDYSGGHAWVIDQKITQKRTVSYYHNDEFLRSVPQERTLVHCNWGWDGSKNGYYFNKAFDTNKGPESATRAENGASWEGVDRYYRYRFKLS